MDPSGLKLTQDECNTYLLRGVMDATGKPGETAPDAQTRCASIVEMFRTFEVTNAMEAWIACHCISLRFMLDAAMRDAGEPGVEPAQTIRLRASALAIGKSLHLWMTSFATMRGRNEARMADQQSQPRQPDAAAAALERSRATMQQPTTRAEPPRPIAAQPAKTPPPFIAAPAGSVRTAGEPSRSMRQELLSSAAVSQGAVSNGRLTGATSPPGR